MKDDYPLYVKWRYIVSYLLDICGKFPKNVCFNLSDRLTNISLDVLELIIEAIYSKIKADILRKANLYMEKLRALLQISVDKKYISMGKYEHISAEINEAQAIIKMLNILSIAEINMTNVNRDIDTVKQYQISFWDSLIIAAAECTGCSKVISEDLNHGQKYHSMLMVNPFL